MVFLTLLCLSIFQKKEKIDFKLKYLAFYSVMF